MDLDQLISPHFTLREAVATTHKDIENLPPDEVIQNLKKVATLLWEPVREKFGPFHVSSGYRSLELNAWVGGSRNSAHLFGCAGDLIPMTKSVTPTDVLAWLRTQNIPYDQAIDEENKSGGRWVHLAICRPGFESQPRKDLLVFRGSPPYKIFGSV